MCSRSGSDPEPELRLLLSVSWRCVGTWQPIKPSCEECILQQQQTPCTLITMSIEECLRQP